VALGLGDAVGAGVAVVGTALARGVAGDGGGVWRWAGATVAVGAADARGPDVGGSGVAVGTGVAAYAALGAAASTTSHPTTARIDERMLTA
jgi:hypothetical protein